MSAWPFGLKTPPPIVYRPATVSPGEFDAAVWAREFVKMVQEKPEIATDEGTMVGWFANAIMAGYDRGRAENCSTPEERWS